MKTQDNLLVDFKNKLPTLGALIGIDYGFKRIGIALSDTRRVLASPFKIIAHLNELDDIVKSRQAVGFVIGMPYETSGNTGKIAHHVQLFAARLIEKYGLPIYFQDERYTSSLAADLLAAAGRTGRRQKKYLDAHAAAVILQKTLDRLGEEEK